MTLNPQNPQRGTGVRKAGTGVCATELGDGIVERKEAAHKFLEAEGAGRGQCECCL